MSDIVDEYMKHLRSNFTEIFVKAAEKQFAEDGLNEESININSILLRKHLENRLKDIDTLLEDFEWITDPDPCTAEDLEQINTKIERGK